MSSRAACMFTRSFISLRFFCVCFFFFFVFICGVAELALPGHGQGSTSTPSTTHSRFRRSQYAFLYMEKRKEKEIWRSCARGSITNQRVLLQKGARIPKNANECSRQAGWTCLSVFFFRLFTASKFSVRRGDSIVYIAWAFW